MTGKYGLVLRAVGKYVRHLVGIVSLYLLVTCFSLWFPKVQGQLIDALTERNTAALRDTTTLIVFIIACWVLIGWLCEALAYAYTTKVKHALLMEVSTGLARKELRFYRKYDAGYTSARLLEVLQLEPLFGLTLISAAMTLIAGVVSLIFLFRIDLTLSLICVSMAPIYLVASTVYTRPLKQRTQVQQESLSLLQQVFVSFYQAMISLRLLNRAAFFEGKMEQRGQTYFHAEFRTSFLRSQFNMFSKMPSQIAPVLVLVVGGAKVMDGTLSVGRLFEYLGYLPLIYLPLQTFSNYYITFINARVLLERINHILLEEHDHSEGSRLALEAPLRTIELEGVDFAYPGGKLLLSGFNLRLERGDVAALVGPSGTGKTTVLNLIMESQTPDRGRVLFNGTDYRAFSRNSKFARILYLPTSPHLVSGSLRENLCLGEAFTDDQLEACLRKVNLWQKLSSLPHGLETSVGELQGTHFSEGEKQRLVLARVLLRDADMLIADETTSNLDPGNEQAIIEILHREFKNKILLFVSHNLKDYYGITKTIPMVANSDH